MVFPRPIFWRLYSSPLFCNIPRVSQSFSIVNSFIVRVETTFVQFVFKRSVYFSILKHTVINNKQKHLLLCLWKQYISFNIFYQSLFFPSHASQPQVSMHLYLISLIVYVPQMSRFWYWFSFILFLLFTYLHLIKYNILHFYPWWLKWQGDTVFNGRIILPSLYVPNFQPTYQPSLFKLFLFALLL